MNLESYVRQTCVDHKLLVIFQLLVVNKCLLRAAEMSSKFCKAKRLKIQKKNLD